MTLQQLLSPTRRAVEEFGMISAGDSIAVGLSGGKDSVTLIHLMAGLKRFYPAPFSLKAIHVDMGFKNADAKELAAVADMCEGLGVAFHAVKTDIAEIIFDVRKEKNPCSLCAKMRRGALCNAAAELGCNKLALGHHADDLIETFFLSMFYEGRLSTFSPVSEMSRSHITLIRPMLYINECDVAAFAKDKPVFHNPCPADKHTQRERVKQFVESLRKENPAVKERIFSAITHPERYNLFPAAKR